jgi:hypothetical protein
MVSRLSAGAASGRAATAEKTLDKLNAEGVKVPCFVLHPHLLCCTARASHIFLPVVGCSRQTFCLLCLHLCLAGEEAFRAQEAHLSVPGCGAHGPGRRQG